MQPKMNSSLFARVRRSADSQPSTPVTFILFTVCFILFLPTYGSGLTTPVPLSWTPSGDSFFATDVTQTLVDSSESSFSRKGDFYLGGLFDVHLEEDGVCQEINPRGLQWMYAMVFGIELINARQDLLPNITLGFHIKDTCGNPNVAVTSSLDFITSSVHLGPCKNNSTRDSSDDSLGSLVAVVGPATSNAAVSVASLFELFQLPEISYSATSELLSHPSFSYFTRVVPSDIYQATALVDIITHFNWSVVAVIASDDLAYGVAGLDRFLEKTKGTGVCVALEERIGSSTTKEEFLDIVKKLRTLPKIKVIVAIANESPMLRLLEAFADLNATGYTFIGTDAWTALPVLTADKRFEKVTQGMLGLRYSAKEVDGFLDYLHKISPAKVGYQDPFLIEYWEKIFKCSIYESLSSRVYKEQCSGDEVLADENTLFAGNLVSSIFDSVEVVAKALHRALKCNETHCDISIKSVNGVDMLALMKNVSFIGKSGYRIEFTDNGDLGLSATYDVFNLKPASFCSDETIVQKIGRWDLNGAFSINGTVTWPSNDSCSQKGPSISICSDPCQPGYRRKSKSECCWDCIQCPENHYIANTNAHKCSNCSSEEIVNAEQTGCMQLPAIYLTLSSPLGILIIAMSIPGIIVAVIFGAIFHHKHDTQVVVRAFTGHNYAILISAILCFILSWMPLFPISDIYCIVKACFQLLPVAWLQGILFLTAYVSHKGRKHMNTRKRILIMLLVLLIYCVFISVWFATGLPRSSKKPDKKEGVVYVDCQEGELSAIALSFSYSILLDTIGLFMAYKTRKKEDNFRESKFLFFSFIVHIMVWVATVGIYFAIEEGKHIRNSLLILGITFTGYIPLMLLYVPKLYALKTKPEANEKVDAKMKRRIKGNNVLKEQSGN